MRHQWHLFLCALQFLTRIPTPTLHSFEPDWIARSARFYPLVGCLVGAVTGLVFLISHQFWSGFVSAALAIGTGIVMTGGFHEDGLGDTADGLGGGQDPEKRLAIMKDSRIGSYGTLAIWSVLSIKLVALTAFPAWTGMLALIIAHTIARACSVAVMHTFSYARDPYSSKIKPTAKGVTRSEMLLALLTGLLTLLFLSDDLTHAFMAVLFAMLSTLILARLSQRLIGGWTGDVLGAIEQCAELAIMLGLSMKLGV
jgi:adenosylcobinamide-GDP ribazoletransferase